MYYYFNATKEGLNPYYTGSTLWDNIDIIKLGILDVLILIILEVLYEYKDYEKYNCCVICLNPYYTGSTLWVW